MIVRPVCEAETLLIDATIVPEPFAALTVIEGEPALRFVNTPPGVERCWSSQVWAPTAAARLRLGRRSPWSRT